MSQRRIRLRPHRSAIAIVASGVALAGCSSGSPSQTVGGTGAPQASSVASAGGSGSSLLAQAVACSQCMRGHGVPSFPDPAQTPDGGYGYRTTGIDPNSTSFQGALQACKGLPSPWSSTGTQLTSAEQQGWLRWAQCIRAHGPSSFPDPTFSGIEVHDPGVASSSQLLQQAMAACTSQRPTVGGLGG